MNKNTNFLEVYLGQDKIAELHHDHNQLQWNYIDAWQQNGYAVSPHLALQTNIDSLNTQVFIRNMLPEGHAFEELSSFFNVSKTNTYALIRILGTDTPSGLIFLPEGCSLPEKSHFRPIDVKELAQRLEHRDDFNLLIWDNKPRLSVAGVQDKLNIVMLPNGDLGFGDGKLASTHILKFEKQKLAHLVLNEYITMQLARSCGLDVADVSIMYFDKHPALLVKRFDRKLCADLEIQRHHMIDGCQALNLPPEYKYERNYGSGRDVAHIRDGVSYKKLFEFAKLCANPAVTKQKIIDWALFNLLIFNYDAHGKNISFFVDEYGISLAPFYDLVNIKMYPHFNSEMAMGFGDDFDSATINSYQIAAFAVDSDISKTFVANRLELIANNILANLGGILGAIDLGVVEAEYLNKYNDMVAGRCNYFLEKIKEIKKVKV